jgi:hypothetical protein
MRIWMTSGFAQRRATSLLRLVAPPPPGAPYQTACSGCPKTRGTQGVYMKMRVQLIIEVLPEQQLPPKSLQSSDTQMT